MARVILGPLYLLTRHAWDSALAHIDSDFYCARFTVSPGWVLGRPAWPDEETRSKWLNATQAVQVAPEELSNDVTEILQTYDTMTL